MDHIKQENQEVFYIDQPIIRIDDAKIQWLKDQAKSNGTGRSRFCVHRDMNDDMPHEMLIVHQNDVYVRPHKHIGKSESFHIIEGEVDIIIFNDEGDIIDVVLMGERNVSGRCFFYRMCAEYYHSLIIRSDLLVFHETTRGPFVKEQTIYASWSPVGYDLEENEQYMQSLDKRCAAFLNK